MKLFDYVKLANMQQINDLLDGDVILTTESDGKNDDLTAYKISDLFDTAWHLMHINAVKNGIDKSDHDQVCAMLEKAFQSWLADSCLDAEDYLPK